MYILSGYFDFGFYVLYLIALFLIFQTVRTVASFFVKDRVLSDLILQQAGSEALFQITNQKLSFSRR